MSRLDEVLSGAARGGGASARTRAAVLAELQRPADRGSWRRDVVALASASWGLLVVVAAVLLATGAGDPRHLLDRATSLVPLLLVGGVSAWAALAPRRRARLLMAAGLAVVAMAALVLTRLGVVPPGPSSGWTCTVSHLGVALPPLAFALWLLRKGAAGHLRALVAGLGVGTVGAGLGELACEQGLAHILLWHVGAWALVGALAMGLARLVPARTYAP